MAYATLADMQALYGTTEVATCSDWDNTGALVPQHVIDALADASDEMDSYIGVRYSLPLDSVPDDLVRRCCEVGMYKLCPYATTLTELKTQRYKDAVAWLTKLADGRVTLGPGQNLQTPAVLTDIEIVSGFPGDMLTRRSYRRIL